MSLNAASPARWAAAFWCLAFCLVAAAGQNITAPADIPFMPADKSAVNV